MKKMILGLLVLTSVVLVGCKQKDTSAVDGVQSGNNEISISTTREQEDEFTESISNIPEWITPYAELEQYPETIYLDEVNSSFAIKDGNLLFPETNIIIVSKELAGKDMESITSNKDSILKIIELLKEEKMLSETESTNSEANLLGLDFDIVFLTVDGKYALMQYDLFDDNRIFVEITTEENDSSISFWVKSEQLAEKIKTVCGYKKYDVSACDELERIEIYNSDGQTYSFTDEELENFKKILVSLKTEVNLCSGPYDIKIIGKKKDGDVSMKWCNDGCGILAIEGCCYMLDDADKEWVETITEKME